MGPARLWSENDHYMDNAPDIALIHVLRFTLNSPNTQHRFAWSSSDILSINLEGAEDHQISKDDFPGDGIYLGKWHLWPSQGTKS